MMWALSVISYPAEGSGVRGNSRPTCAKSLIGFNKYIELHINIVYLQDLVSTKETKSNIGSSWLFTVLFQLKSIHDKFTYLVVEVTNKDMDHIRRRKYRWFARENQKG